MRLAKNQLQRRFIFMDKESILRLGLEHYDIDVESSDELYDQTTNNHIILLKLKIRGYTCLSSLWIGKLC